MGNSPLNKKIVMVGISLASNGGMVSVAQAYQRGGIFDQWNIKYLVSYKQRDILMQLEVMARALAIFLHMLLKREVGLLHVHSASRGSFWRKSIFCMLSKIFRVPYILHMHSGEFPVFVREECGFLARKWVHYIFQNAHTVIALTSSWRDSIAALIPNAAVVVLGNPVFVPDHIREQRATGFQVLFLGRLNKNKGVFDLIRAIPKVLEQLPQATFILAGDGELDNVAHQAEILGIKHAVILPGWVEGCAKDALLASADLLVLPSYYEGLPVCILEAMAAGVPVLSSAVGGIPDVLEDGACGVLISPGDVDALSTALIDSLLDSEGSERRRKQAYLRVKKYFSISKILENLGYIYHAAKLKQDQ